MTCVSIVTNNFTAFPFLKEVLFVYRGAISQLDKNEAMFIFVIETVSLFILNGDFDEYLNNIKTLYEILAAQEQVVKICCSVFFTCNLWRNPINRIVSDAFTLIITNLT